MASSICLALSKLHKSVVEILLLLLLLLSTKMIKVA